MNSPHQPGVHDSPLVRAAFLGVGSAALLLGLVGVFLPLLPTTPFILLAAACFARGSERVHKALLAHRIAGPIIRDWQTHRSMPPGVKPWAYLTMAVSFGLSIIVVPSLWHRAILIVIAAALTFFVWRIPVRNDGVATRRSGADG